MEHLLFIVIGLIMAGLVTMIAGMKNKALTTIGLMMISMGGAGLGYMAVEDPPFMDEKTLSSTTP